MKSRTFFTFALSIAAIFFTSLAVAETDEPAPLRQYTYAWQFSEDGTMAPRGGTTRGPGVVLDLKAGDAWLELSESGIPAQERDRRAILAMAGAYRASFDFLETVSFTDEYTVGRPYQSWGTEYVYVVENEPHFVSLQHIMVMFFEADDGNVMGPIVVKHWRQDWHFEDRELHEYVGHNTWRRRVLSEDESNGKWSQSVFQVDDSPRYQAIGRWQHHGNYSSWTSENTWRPLPRREYSVRDDYHVLSGTNRHTITPTGWIHEEDNLKLVLDADGNPATANPYISREAGFNRYERIIDHDFSAGDEYWEVTGEYWSDVRSIWGQVLSKSDSLTLHSKYDDQSLFQVLFAYANTVQENGEYDSQAGRRFIRKTLDQFAKTSGD